MRQKCHKTFELVQSMKDAALDILPQGPLPPKNVRGKGNESNAKSAATQ